MMKFSRSFGVAALSALALSACGGSGGAPGGARDFVRAVGSSTVYPFATAVAEQFAKAGDNRSPIIESTGTGAGIKLFCGGLGAQYPDVANASRRIKASELEECVGNGVAEVVEVQVGIDGIAFAEAANGPGLALTPQEIYEALAANPYGTPNAAKNWSDVNPALPAIPILVYGPPTTSGTRDALAELILEAGCKANPEMAALKEADEKKHKAICTEVRDDGAYVDSGENDNLIVQKISQNPRAVGVFGFSFLEANTGKVRGIPMSGVAPTYETISSFEYPGARPLYIYVKKGHLNAVKGLQGYIDEWARAWGPDGYLKDKGMVISPDDVRTRNAEVVANMTPLDGAKLK